MHGPTGSPEEPMKRVLLLGVCFLVATPAWAQEVELTLGHQPPATAKADQPLHLDFRVEPVSALGSAAVLYRALSATEWQRAPVEMSSTGTWSATVPAAAMDDPGIEYCVVATNTQGIESLQFASLDAPHPVIVRGDLARERERSTLAELDGLRSELQVGGAWVDYRVFGATAGKADDVGPRYTDYQVRYRYWLLRGVEYIEAGVGRLDGTAASVPVASYLPPVEPAKATHVGFQRGWTEVGFRPGDSVGLAARLLLGADEEGFRAGLAGILRLGRPRQTRLEFEAGTVGGVGWHFATAFHLTTIPRLPASFEVVLNNEPNAGSEAGEMARLRVGWEATRKLTLGVVGSYQGRDGNDHGLGAGADALLRF